MADLLIGFWKKAIDIILKRISGICSKLIAANLKKQALQFVIGFNETHYKINVYLQNAEQKIKDLNALNWQHDDSIHFTGYQEVRKKNALFKDQVFEQIWGLVNEVRFTEEDEDDIQGHAYQIISGDLIGRILRKDGTAENIIKYLDIFVKAAVAYIEDLRKRYAGDENWVRNNVRLYPLIMDIMQLNALAIIVGKIYTPQIVDRIFEMWNKLFEEESERVFWAFLYTAYQIYSQPQYGLSTNAYQNEHERNNALETFLVEQSVIKKKAVSSPGRMSYGQEYVTTIPDAYIQAMAKHIDAERGNDFKLHELFIEYFLRTRIALKDIPIEETRYGRTLNRFMGIKD
jgi:hypothetical protein